MIHGFTHDDINIVLDVESNAVHVLDDCSYALICDKVPRGVFSEELLSSARAELAELERSGKLYSRSVVLDDKTYGEQVVKALCLHVAHDCNLRCKYCFAGNGEYGHGRELMSAHTVRAAIDFLVHSSGTRMHCEIDFFGGEPLLNWEVVRHAVQYMREVEASTGKIFKLTLTTNALALTPDKISYLNEQNISLVLSIDGRPDIHNTCRPDCGGQPSYERVLRGIMQAVRARDAKNYYIRGTYTALNTDFFEDVRHIVDMGFNEISFEPVVTKNERMMLKSEHLPMLYEQYEKLAQHLYNEWLKARAVNFFHYNIELDGGPCIYKRVSGCGAGNDYLAVDPTGKLFPCHQFVGKEEFNVGDVFTGISNRYVADTLKQANIFAKEQCGQCWAKYFCSGGCHANNYNENGNLLMPYELGCELQKKRLEMALWLKVKKTIYNKGRVL